MSEHHMWIDGEPVPARSAETREVTNPADGQAFAEVSEGGREDARAAAAAARRAFSEGLWPVTLAPERGQLLYALAEKVEAHKDELAALETRETGKTLSESGWDVADVAGIFRYYAGLADKDAGELLDSPNPSSTSLLVREPAGVCAQISPWNYPLLQASWKMAPALAAGCTMVIKPSELTPLSTLRLTALAHELDLPAGVVNTVLGPGSTVGAELVESPDVDLVSFTGGVVTGRGVMRAAAESVKRVTLELGGKNPHIVFADADLDTALDKVLDGVFFHAGQICSAGSRLMLEDTIHDRFVEALAARMRHIRLGHGSHPDTQMGPLISEEHRRKVEALIILGVEEGARLVLGGRRPDREELRGGFFYEPTLLTDCAPPMRILREEIFGPVLTVERFSDEDEVVARANDTDYGLAAGFWTRSSDRMSRVARRLRFGTVWVNDFNVYFVQAPWGGFKQSGVGRELGREGLQEYTEAKHVYTNHDPRPSRWFGT